ncbi:hypothetical protein L7F22_039105 [Adiantum nelumboides]|nr:hypothetical protein [Adiantum nelumboides]
MAQIGQASQQSEFSLPNHIQRLFIDVESHQIPNLVTASTLDDAERELHQTIRRIENELEMWEIDVRDAGRNRYERQEWQKVLQESNERLKNIQRLAKRSLIDARKQQRNIQPINAQQARNDLFGDMAGSESERKRRREGKLQNQTADEQLMTASGDVTAALQRAVKSMSTELEKSSYSAQLLDESTISIQQATLQYTSFTDLVASSQKLIKSMERADMIDAAFLIFSFLFFIGCIIYILKVRIWNRGVGILSFFFRIFSLTSSRSPADVQEKLKLAKEAALASSKSIAAQLTSSALSASAAASAAAIAASQSAQQVKQQASIPDSNPSATVSLEDKVDLNLERTHDEL